jgi:hypothetical protein
LTSPIVNAASSKNIPLQPTTLTDVYVQRLQKALKKLQSAQQYCSHLEALNDQLLIKRLEGAEVVREFHF